MLAIGIMVVPMNNTSLRIPLVLTKERNSVATLERFDVRCDVDIVCDKKGMPGGKPEDKWLVAASVVVVR